MNESAQPIAKTYLPVNITPSQIENFWAQVEKIENGCWEWTGFICKETGYGRMNLNGQVTSCHRISLHLSGHDVTKGQALHHCDNKKCVCPDHLYIGNYRDNVRDREQRNPGTQARGEAAAKAKLTEQQVREIRIKYAGGGYTNITLGAEYGISGHQVCMIVLRRNWKHVT